MRDERATFAGIPIRWVVDDERGAGDAPPRVALWLPYLSGSKDDMLPMLERSATAGFFAVSFDPWRHGARATESADQLTARVFGAFRREMWPTIGQTTLDAMCVLDWVEENHDVTRGTAVAGGLSMGGDICVALAGVDRRVTRVAAIGSTPDWTRPGMHRLGGDDVVDQGEPGAYGEWLYERLDPVTHPGNYAHGPAILFEHGGADRHVPVEAAHRFAELVNEHRARNDRTVSVRVTDGLGHLDSVRNPDAVDRCFAWLGQPT